MYRVKNYSNKITVQAGYTKERQHMNNYKVELENDEFSIIQAETDAEAIAEALEENDTVYNVIRIDDDYNEIETIY